VENGMSESETLALLGTRDCSLCESALNLLMSMPELRGTRLRVVDILDLHDGVERYGHRIPVLSRAGQELDAPLTRERIIVWYRRLPDPA
jgi:hypothetical protein